MLSDNYLTEFKKYRYNAIDKSISTKLLTPFWNFLLNYIPYECPPNIITLSGLLFILFSWFVSYYPSLLSVIISSISLFIYQTLDALDGKQARKTNQSSNLGELFDHICDNISVVFIILTLCNYGDISYFSKIMITILMELLFMLNHIVAYKNNKLIFEYISSGELLILIELLMFPLYYYKLNNYASYLVILILLIANILETTKTQTTPYYFSNVWNNIPTFLLISLFTLLYGSSDVNIITYGLLVSILTTDVIISKMVNKSFDNYMELVIFSMLPLNIKLYVSMLYIIYRYGRLILYISNKLNIKPFDYSPNRTLYLEISFDKEFTLCDIISINKIINKYKDEYNNIIIGECYAIKKTLINIDNIINILNDNKYVSKIMESPYKITNDFIINNKIDVFIRYGEICEEIKKEKYNDIITIFNIEYPI